jgi:hypothetical protein
MISGSYRREDEDTHVWEDDTRLVDCGGGLLHPDAS